MATTTRDFVRALTARHDVLVIGGLAVIGHGLNRPTKDVDLWLDPLDSAEAWAAAVARACSAFPSLTIHTLPGWRRIDGPAIAAAATDVGMVRILGLDCPLDLFRQPNEFAAAAFPEVLSRASRNVDGTWLPDPLDLAISKDLTGRDQDVQDIRFLETKVRNAWVSQLPTASLEEAQALFARYVDWETCAAALRNPDPRIHAIARSQLEQFAAEGDPFSLAILEGRLIPPP